MVRKQKIIKWTVIITVVAAAIWAGVRFVGSDHVETDAQLAEAKIAGFDVTVNTIGTLDAERSYVVSSTIKGEYGKIVYIADEGAFIKKGDVLVEFDSAYFESEILNLTGELRSLEASLEAREQVLEWEKSQAEGSIRSAEFDLNDAKQEYNRYMSYISDLEALGKKGLNYPNEIYQAKEKAEQLLAKQQRYETSFEQINKESVFKIAAATAELGKVENEIETKKISLSNMRDELEKAIVRAPYAGIVVHYEAQRDNQKRKPRIGDTVWQNQPLLYLPDISSMIVKALVREVDLYKIAKGQRASIRVDAYPNSILAGTVASIGVMASNDAQSGSGEKYFQVGIAIKGENSNLRPGMTAKVTVNIDNARDVLAVPVHAVFSENAERYCYVAAGAKVKKAKVKIGRQNEDYAEIVEGLKAGDTVSLIRPVNAE